LNYRRVSISNVSLSNRATKAIWQASSAPVGEYAPRALIEPAMQPVAGAFRALYKVGGIERRAGCVIEIRSTAAGAEPGIILRKVSHEPAAS
jgi:hypothetical protein